MVSEHERRRFQRVRTPVLWRSRGRPLFQPQQRPIDLSEGGLRIYADENMTPGERLEIELFLPDGTSVECEVEVVWIEPLAEGFQAQFDVGLRFLAPSRTLLERLAPVLAHGDPTPPRTRGGK